MSLGEIFLLILLRMRPNDKVQLLLIFMSQFKQNNFSV